MATPPPDWLIRALRPQMLELADGATRMLEELPYVVTSWYRDPDHNAAVGGHPFSLHLVGLAFDAQADDPVALAEAARSAGFPQVVPSVSSRTRAPYVHVGLWPAGTLERLVRARSAALH